VVLLVLNSSCLLLMTGVHPLLPVGAGCLHWSAGRTFCGLGLACVASMTFATSSLQLASYETHPGQRCLGKSKSSIFSRNEAIESSPGFAFQVKFWVLALVISKAVPYI
jgi:hypothetical protein